MTLRQFWPGYIYSYILYNVEKTWNIWIAHVVWSLYAFLL